MHSKKKFHLKNICFFKSPNQASWNHLSNEYNHIMRQMSSDVKFPHDKKHSMCFPTTTERANSNSGRKYSKISLKKKINESQSRKNISRLNTEPKQPEEFDSNNNCTSNIGNTKTNLYNELSSQLKNYSHVSRSKQFKSFKSFNDLSNEDKFSKSNINNNFALTSLKPINNPSSLKSTSASKESNNSNSIKIINKINNHTYKKSKYNHVDDIDTPEELHYFYVGTLQSGKIAENKF